MAYNYPLNYQQLYSPQPNAFQAAAPSQSNLIWVQGEAGAKSYMVAPNNTVQLWDSEQQTIYLKSADASGMPSMKILDYTIRQSAESQPTPLTPPQNDFATKDEVSTIRDEIAALRSHMDALERGVKNAEQSYSDNKPAKRIQK